MADISRADAIALIDQQNSGEIIEEATQSSVALASFRKIPMGAKQLKMRLIDALPTAGFIATDTGRKPTTEQIWANKYLEAEEIACIVPIPENVFDDTSFGVWENVRPRIAEAFGAALDGAVLFGYGAPSSWSALDLAAGSAAAGNVLSRGVTEGRRISDSVTLTDTGDVVTTGVDHGLSIGDTVVFGTITTTAGLTAGTTYYVRTTASSATFTVAATPGGATVALTTNGSAASVTETGSGARSTGQDLAYSVSEAMGKVEDDGFDPDSLFTTRTLRRELRNLRDNNGQPLYAPNLTGGVAGGQLWGLDVRYSRNNAFAHAGTVKAIIGDASKAVLGIRQDVQYKILTEATLTDGAGNITIALAEEDTIALRAKMRIAFQVLDPTTIVGGNTAYPFVTVTT